MRIVILTDQDGNGVAVNADQVASVQRCTDTASNVTVGAQVLRVQGTVAEVSAQLEPAAPPA